MKTGAFCFLLALSVCSATSHFVFSSNSKSPNLLSSPAPSPTPPVDEVSARASDVPPPPLWASKIRNPHVKYVQTFELKAYPVPAVIFRRERLAREDDWTEIREKIIYPAINKSDKPIAAVIVEFFPDTSDIGVTLIWHGVNPSGSSNYSSASISRTSSGHFAADAYLRLFPEEDR